MKGSSCEADEGCTDDFVACLFLFAWASNQTYFKDLLDSDLRIIMYSDRMKAMEEDLTPFGIISTGLESDGFTDTDGEHWTYV